MLPLDSSENEFNEEVIITSILQQENEVSNERHHKVKPRPPQYPIEILKEFEMSDRFTRFGSGEDSSKDRTMLSKPRDRLFHVWLPVDVIGKSVMLVIFTIIKVVLILINLAWLLINLETEEQLSWKMCNTFIGRSLRSFNDL